MTYSTTEEIEATIAAMDRFELAAESDPSLVEKFFELLHERPETDHQTSNERYENLMKELAAKRNRNGDNGSSHK